MTTLVLGAAGAAIGGFFGGPVGAQIGFLAGSLLGNLIDPPKVQGPRLGDDRLQVSTYGKVIPYVWGKGRVAGNIIDAMPRVEHEESSGGKGSPEVTSYTYTRSFMVLLAQRLPARDRAIEGITRLWADGDLIWSDSSGDGPPCAVYLGDETQLPDPTFEAYRGVGECPAYRGRAYLVFTDFNITDYGGRIPQIDAEVWTKQGSGIPWRVSTFDSEPHTGTTPQVTYNNGVLTTSAAVGARPHTFYTNKFNTDGTSAGAGTSEVVAGFAPYAGIANSNVYAGIAADGFSVYWFTPDPDTGVLSQGLQFPSNVFTAPHRISTGPLLILQNEFLYTVGGTLTYQTIGRYDATGGVPSTSFIDYVELDAAYAASTVCLGTSDTGHLYVRVKTGSSTQKMWRFNPDLTLSHFWDESDMTGLYVHQEGHFHVYKGLVVTNYTTGGLYYVALIKIAADESLSNYGTPMLHSNSSSHTLQGGLLLDVTGVYSLDPPPGQVLLSDIVADLTDMTPAAGHYDVSELTDEVRWFVVGTQMTVRNALAILRPAFFFDAVESDDLVKFRKRGASVVAAIPDADLGARNAGEAPVDPLRTIRRREAALPRTVSMNYIDVDFDYQTGTQSSPRQVTMSQSDVTLEIPVGFTAGEAAQKCWSIQCEEWMQRETFEWSTTRKWAKLEPCDVVTVRGRTIRIQTRQETPTGVIRFSGVLAAPSLYTQVAPGAPNEGHDPQDPPTAKAATRLVLLDLPLIADGDYPTGFYAAMCKSGAGAWPGATLYQSVDGGTTYNAIATKVVEDVIGDVATALGSFDGGNVFDESNMIRVIIGAGTLDSATELAVLNGANMAVLGHEVFQFRTATLVGTLTYDLSGLLRGRRGTEWAIGTHGPNEIFVLLPTTNINAPASDLNQTRLYKPVTMGTTIGNTTAQSFVNTGMAARCYAPNELAGGIGASNEILMQWQRRTRIGGAWVDNVDVPLSEASEQYVIEIWDSTYTVCARVVSGLTSPSYTYSSANQTTDFGALQSTYYVTVAQLGAYQLGIRARATMPGAGGVINAPVSPVDPYNPPASPGEGGGAVNVTLAYPNDNVHTSGLKIGDTYVAKFTTGGSAPTGGYISTAEFAGTPYIRHTRLCTDVNGVNLVPNGEKYGNPASTQFGSAPGSCSLAPSTAYYLIIKMELGNGDPSGPLGTPADVAITIAAT